MCRSLDPGTALPVAVAKKAPPGLMSRPSDEIEIRRAQRGPSLAQQHDHPAVMGDHQIRPLIGNDQRREPAGLPFKAQHILTVLEIHHPVRAAVCAKHKHIRAGPAVQRVVAFAALQQIATRAAVQDVRLAATFQHVIAVVAFQNIRATKPSSMAR